MFLCFRDEMHRILLRAESRIRVADIIGDDHIEPFSLSFFPCVIHQGFRLGSKTHHHGGPALRLCNTGDDVGVLDQRECQGGAICFFYLLG